MPYALLSCSFVTLLYCYCFLNEINGDGDGDGEVNWLQVQPQRLPGFGLRKDIRLDWPTVMFDDFLHQLVSGSLPL